MSSVYNVTGEITEIYHPKYIALTIIKIIPNESLLVEVTLYDENLVFLLNKKVKIEGEEYQLWREDDFVLLNLITSKLGISLVR